LNPTFPNAGTIWLRAIFPNADGRLVPGLFARIRIPTSDRRPTFLVDESAIGTDQSQKFVLTLGEDNTVEYRQVKLGPAIGGKRIVREGLRAGKGCRQRTATGAAGAAGGPEERPVPPTHA
jgi:multidrug efflux system membrane fusion protein